ncbi:MAG: DMT family transporter [Hyphomicrobiales bacterium]|nr:MAG: DMT family transporter [Hyphomicrobiales bacterium]
MRARDWLLLTFLSILWGCSFFLVAVSLRGGIAPLTLVLLRVALGAMVLVPAVLALGHRMPATTAGWLLFVVQAFLNNVLPFSLIFFGQTMAASSLAAVMNATTPLFGLLVARFVGGEPLTANRAIGVLFGITGVAILVGPEIAGANMGTLLGMGCFLGAALCYGFSAQWMKRLRQVPPIVSAASQLTCSTVMMLPIALAVDRFWTLPAPSLPIVAAVVSLALFSTALAYIVFFRISASAGPQNVMLVTLLVPVSATALGVILLDEALTVHQVLGALVIALGLVVVDGRLIARLPALRTR